VATHPDSFFRGHLMAARPTATGRHGLLDRAYTRRDTSGDLVEQRTVADPEDLVELLAGAFGLVLPAAERAAVARRLADLPVG
jgi:arylamine N-acetyltransferase